LIEFFANSFENVSLNVYSLKGIISSIETMKGFILSIETVEESKILVYVKVKH